jgi:hypothetical protein
LITLHLGISKNQTFASSFFDIVRKIVQVIPMTYLLNIKVFSD